MKEKERDQMIQQVTEKAKELNDIIRLNYNKETVIPILVGLRRGFDLNLKGAVLIKDMIISNDAMAKEIKENKEQVTA